MDAERIRVQGPARAGPDDRGGHRARPASSKTARSSRAGRAPALWRVGEAGRAPASAGRASRADTASHDCACRSPGSNPIALQAAFGYTSEELVMVLRPMVENGAEAIGSMGDDTRPAVLSDKPRPLFGYFRQRFAEVTNPPIDPLREELVMSLRVRLGARGNFLAETPEQARLLELDSPFLTDAELAALRADPELQGRHALHAVPGGRWRGRACARRSTGCAREAEAGRAGRGADAHPQRPGRGRRAHLHPAAPGAGRGSQSPAARRPATTVDLVIESGEPREVHHFAVLVGYGAAAINPYLALATGCRAGARRVGARQAAAAQLPPRRRARPAQDHVQDGHQHRRCLLRRADLRDRRPEQRGGGRILHRHARAPGRHSIWPVSPRSCLRWHAAAFGDRLQPSARQPRLLQVQAQRRTARLQPGDRPRAARGRAHARRAQRPLARGLRRLTSATASFSTCARPVDLRDLLDFTPAASSRIPLSATVESSRTAILSAASPPRPCRTARCRPRRTRRWPSR